MVRLCRLASGDDARLGSSSGWVVVCGDCFEAIFEVSGLGNELNCEPGTLQSRTSRWNKGSYKPALLHKDTLPCSEHQAFSRSSLPRTGEVASPRSGVSQDSCLLSLDHYGIALPDSRHKLLLRAMTYSYIVLLCFRFQSCRCEYRY